MPEGRTGPDQLDGQRLEGAAALADVVVGKEHPPGMTHEELAAARASLRDTIWTHNSPLLYRLLVLQRGWPVEQYGEWVRRGLRAHAGTALPTITG